MTLSLSFLAALDTVEPPTGVISPIAWVIIIALATALASVTTALWYRGNKIQDRAEKVQDKMYEDLKICNQQKLELEDEVLGLLKVLRLQMDYKGGKKR